MALQRPPAVRITRINTFGAKSGRRLSLVRVSCLQRSLTAVVGSQESGRPNMIGTLHRWELR